MATPSINFLSHPLKFSLLAIITALCFTASHWILPLQEFVRFNLFLTPESMTILGVIITGYLLSPYWIPTFCIAWAEKTARFLAKHYFVTILAILGCSLAAIYLINQNTLLSFLNSADEHSCYFAAECIKMGKWWVKPHDLSEFFNVVHVGTRDAKWFSVYPPGWPAIWALGLRLNLADWLNPCLSILSLFLLFLSAKKVYETKVALAGLFFTAATPFFMFTSASYFSHSTCLFTISLFIYSFLRWMESQTAQERVFWAFLCALAGGYGLLTRYLTMAAIMAPFIIYRGFNILRKKSPLDRADFVFAGVLGFMMVLVLAHNHAVTGKPFKAPNKYDKSWERLGFKGSYSVKEGLTNILTRLFYLSDWASPIFVMIFSWLSFQRTKEAQPFQVIFNNLFWWNAWAYFFYFSWGGNQYGPRYYYEAFPFLVLAVMHFFYRSWKSAPTPQKKGIIAILILTLVTTPLQFAKQIDYFHLHTSQRKALFALAESTLQGDSLVFIRGSLGTLLPLSEDDAVRNSPSLGAKVLYAHDLGPKNSLLMDYYPSRKAYIGWFDKTAKAAVLEPAS